MSSVILEPFKITDQAELLVISEEIFFFFPVGLALQRLGYACGVGSAGLNPGVTSYTGADTRPVQVWKPCTHSWRCS